MHILSSAKNDGPTSQNLPLDFQLCLTSSTMKNLNHKKIKLAGGNSKLSQFP